VLPDHLLVAEIVNFDAGPPGSTFRFASDGGTTFDGGGRFELVQSNGKWYLAVKSGALLDYEDLPIIQEVAIERVSGGSVIDEGTFDFYLNNKDETTANQPPTVAAPTQAGQGTIVGGNVQVNENVGAVQIFDVNATDPDGTIASYAVSGTYPAGAFSIDANGTVSVNTAVLGNITADTTYVVRVTATDNEGATGFRDVNVVVKDVPPPQNQKPTIDVNGGTQIIGATANGPAVKAFYDIQVGDFEDDSLTMSISFASNDGELRDQNNQVIAVKSDDGITKVYEFTGRKDVLNAILDELKFDAKNRSDGGIVDTNFTVKVWDIDHQGSPAQNNQITVSTALMNRAPTINLSDPKTFHVNDINDAVYAFGGFDLDDIERDQLTVTIKFDEDDGDLVGVNLPDPERIAGQKVYKFVNRTAGELELILDNLRFNATDRPNQNSGTVETTFTVEVSDGDKTATNGQLKVITDVVNKQPPTRNQAPTGLSLSLNAPLLSEYAVPGKDVVGTLSATDADGDVLTYKLLDNAGGRFAIDGNKLVLAGLGVNFEDVPSHQIKVEASDGKATTEQVFTIGIKDETTLNIKGTKKNDKLNGGLLDDILKGGSGTGNDTIKGSTGDDKLYGENGNDSLQGGDGIDSLFGGAGNDTLKGEAGRDLVKGDAGNDKAYGGSGNDKLYGGKGNDLLKGDADDDILYGEAGNDQLYGGKGKDVFVFNQKPSKTANLDKIMDFNVADDTIWLENKIFTKLGKAGSEALPAALNAVSFVTGSKAKDSKDYIIYDKKKGILYYDADGTGKSAAVEIATIKKGLKLTFDDFKII
jgi:Ca2+-binding RTX toxin-like protein